MPLLLTMTLVLCGSPTTTRGQAVTRELDALMAVDGVKEAVIVVVDAQTGEVVEQAARGPTPLPEVHLLPGSVMKSFTYAAALEAKAVTVKDRLAGSFGTLHDATRHDEMTLEDALAFSSNVGAAQVAQKAGVPALQAMFDAVGLPPPSKLATMPDDLATRFAVYGEGFEPTPPQLARAFARAFASKAPTMMSPRTQAAMVALLEKTVSRNDGTGARARVKGRRIAGKTGTSPIPTGGQWGTFVGFEVGGPWVVLVAVESSRDDYGGGTVAAPAFARLLPKLGT